MRQCDQDGCGWHAVAPTDAAAHEQYLEHLATEHVEDVDAEVPEGTVQVMVREEEGWVTMTPEEAMRLHDEDA